MKKSGSESDKSKNNKPHGNSKPGVSNETIYKLKELRFSNEDISEYYKKMGISINRTAIGRRVKLIYAELGKKPPRGYIKRTLNSLEEELSGLVSKKEKSSKMLEEFEELEELEVGIKGSEELEK